VIPSVMSIVSFMHGKHILAAFGGMSVEQVQHNLYIALTSAERIVERLVTLTV